MREEIPNMDSTYEIPQYLGPRSTHFHTNADDDEFFYCGYTDLDDTNQGYNKFGKGTDFIFNEGEDRWERITDVSAEYIYSGGRYEQVALVSYWNDELLKG